MSNNSTLKGILKEFSQEYQIACEKSRKEYLASLPVGQPIPPTGKIYGEAYRNDFMGKTVELSSRANAIFDKELESLRSRMATAPNSDAVNTLTLAGMRPLTDNDINAYLQAYGENYQSYQTIKSLAQKNNLKRVPDHELEQREADINDLSMTFRNALTLYSAEAGRASEGFADFISSTIDDVITD